MIVKLWQKKEEERERKMSEKAKATKRLIRTEKFDKAHVPPTTDNF